MIPFSDLYAEWTLVHKRDGGLEFYVDLERIKKIDGFVYYWTLQNMSLGNTPYRSGIIYNQGDCKLIRKKVLQMTMYEKRGAMGSPIKVPKDLFATANKFNYILPNSGSELMLNKVCNH
tara:strand:- start:405 stop:761 length:357 start_codon:yes stop_codon:yes gene_type:complete